MQATLIAIATGLVALGWWTTTLRAFELQTILGAELIGAGCIVALLALVPTRRADRRTGTARPTLD